MRTVGRVTQTPCPSDGAVPLCHQQMSPLAQFHLAAQILLRLRGSRGKSRECLAIKQPMKELLLSQGWKAPLCHIPQCWLGAQAGSGLTPNAPPCEPGVHGRGLIGRPVGAKKLRVSLCMQLCPCLQAPALGAAFRHGDTAPAPLPAATHTCQSRCGPARAAVGSHGQWIATGCAVRGKKRGSLALINT